MDSFTSLLLVEGKTDKYFVEQLLRQLKLEQNFGIISSNGVDKLLDDFQIHLKSTNVLKKLWIIIDADACADDAWFRVRARLIESGNYSRNIDSRALFPASGIILPDDSDGIVVGIWVMPNNLDAGMLESFLLNLVHENDSLIDHAINTVDGIEGCRDSHPNLYKKEHLPKAKIHTWLAWQDEPGISLGTAMHHHLFQLDNHLCKQFTDWLERLND